MAGWSIAQYSAEGDFTGMASNSSGSVNVHSPLPKRQNILVPALPVVVSQHTAMAAGGDLVHVHQSMRESDSLSNISAASSNRLAILQASHQLAQALLNQARQETAVRQLELQMVEAQGQGEQPSMEADDNLTAELGELMREQELENKKLELQQEYDQQARLLHEQAQQIEIQRQQEQQKMQRAYEQSLADTRKEAEAEAARRYYALREEFAQTHSATLAELKTEALRHEQSVMAQFAQAAEARHSVVIAQELGAAQSLTFEQVAELEHRAESRHREAIATEETAVRLVAQAQIEAADHTYSEELAAKHHQWKREANETMQRFK